MLRIQWQTRVALNTYFSSYNQRNYDKQIKKNDQTEEWEKAQPYSKIPGPKSYPLLGNALEHIFGKFKNKTPPEVTRMLHEEYGNICKLTGFVGREDFVFIFDPDDIEMVYRNEGAYPWRRSMESFKYYRKHVRPDVFGNVIGLGNAQGEEWQRMRTIVNPLLMNTNMVRNYVAPVEEIADEFIARMLRIREANNEMPDDFLNELNKWALESIARIVIDKRLGCFEDNLKSDSELQELIASIYGFFDLMYNVEILPSPWKLISTPAFRKLMKAFDVMTNITMKHVDEAIERIKKNPNQIPEHGSIIAKLLQVDRKVAIVMALDMILAGVDTTSSTLATLLFYIATHQSAQDKLREEIKAILPNKDSKLPENFMNSIPYLRACLKESLRISPAFQRIVRKVPKDLVISGYQIPKGTDVLLAHIFLQLSESQYTKPKEFIPERWLSMQESGCPGSAIPNVKEAHPFCYMPFGFGPRMCVGRRFAELEIATIVMKLLRNYRIEWHHGKISYKTTIFSRPASPLKFQMYEI